MNKIKINMIKLLIIIKTLLKAWNTIKLIKKKFKELTKYISQNIIYERGDDEYS